MPCLACGTCCHSDLLTYVRVLGVDHARLGASVERLSHFIGNRCFMRMEDGHCAALVIEDDLFVCSIYTDRPEVCRELAEGSSACAAEISAKAARPKRTLRLLQARRGEPHSFDERRISRGESPL